VQLWCGIDWAENHHDVSVVDEEGRQRVRLRIADTAAGFSELMSMLAEQQGQCEQPISVAIETSKGLLPAALRASGIALVAINPLAVSRYRDRLSPSRAKSDAGDAFVLANILRTDPHNHRPLPVDSELARQSTSWPELTRTRCGTGCRSRTSCARRCASTTRRSWPPSTIWPAAKPAQRCTWRPLRARGSRSGEPV
jgi:transposase